MELIELIKLRKATEQMIVNIKVQDLEGVKEKKKNKLISILFILYKYYFLN